VAGARCGAFTTGHVSPLAQLHVHLISMVLVFLRKKSKMSFIPMEHEGSGSPCF
jgi:hypothetical protein